MPGDQDKPCPFCGRAMIGERHTDFQCWGPESYTVFHCPRHCEDKLRFCPTCEAKIARKTTQCPQCGERLEMDLTPQERVEQQRIIVAQKAEEERNQRWIGCAVLLFCLVAFLKSCV